MTSCSVCSSRDAVIASSMSLVRATTEGRTPGHRLSMNQGTSSRNPGTTESQVTTANGHVRKARASGSSKSLLRSSRADSSARNSALCSAVRLACPSRTDPARGSRLCRLVTKRWAQDRSEEHTSELQSRLHLVCRLLLEKKKKKKHSKIRNMTTANQSHI